MNLNTRKLLFWLLLGILCVTLLPFLGLNDFHTKGEPREAVVSYSMIETGNWILPENAGGDMAYKPPFFHWCVALASLPMGEVTEFSSRLPSAVALILMACAFFLFFSKRTDVYRSFLATLIFISSFEVHRAGMNARVDMVLTAMIVMAIFQLYRWWENGFKGIPFWAILFMSFGTLTKGPVGFILPCASCGLFLLLNNVSFMKAFLKMALAGVLSCILPAVWYYLAYLQGGEEFVGLVMEENFGRFLGKMSYRSHENPVHYNFLTMIAGYIPWTLLLVFSLFVLNYKNLRERSKGIWARTKNWFATADRVRVYALVSAVLIFVFYCIPKSKRSVYLLPVYPFVAIFIADLFIWLIQYKPGVWRVFGWVIASLTALVLALFGAIKAGIVRPDSFLSGKAAVKATQYVSEMDAAPLGFVGFVSILVAIIFLVYFFKEVRKREWSIRFMGTVIALVFGLQILLDGVIQPAILNHKSIKKFAHEVEEIVPEGAIYGYIPVEMLRFYIVNFYIGNRVHLFDAENPGSGYLLVGERAFHDIIEPQYGDKYNFEKVIRTPHDDTEIRDYIWLYRFDTKSKKEVQQ
ncbi:MAG: glycosyltransferase family 39 protein [Bacteroidales bacterium]